MILVDSNIIIDIIRADSIWSERTAAAVAAAADSDDVAINPVVYAEIAAGFETLAEVEAVLGSTGLVRLPLPYEAAFVAGQAFGEYRRRGGPRSSLLSDFFIGAHAAVEGISLLTRDPARYRSYFPGVALIQPR
jgi:predicted nucleic acid-binding protein